MTISGNLNFRVADPRRALLEVQDYRYSIQQLSLTTIADVLGTKTIEEVRTSKVEIGDEIEKIVAERATTWGLAEVDIRLTDARMDESLMRAMMRETEAHKEARAIQIKAESDREVAEIFAEAARALASSPGAMTLRVLQTLSDISNDKATVVIPIPVDMLSALGGNGGKPPG
ncbi:MAG: SPFH domain-containing protein [Planctomycetota bacterium]|nr:SPFH domain-containing protein [Planctomycetota bacterium]